MTLASNDTTLSIRPAVPGDRQAVEKLLLDSNLPTAGIDPSLPGFLVAEMGDSIVGAIGLERYESFGLLRSAVVHPSLQGRGVGRQLVQRLIDSARADGVAAIYLLTTTAESWFPLFGFAKVERSVVPPEIQGSVEFAEACPSSATVMHAPV